MNSVRERCEAEACSVQEARIEARRCEYDSSLLQQRNIGGGVAEEDFYREKFARDHA
jgi:hypothetical protein